MQQLSGSSAALIKIIYCMSIMYMRSTFLVKFNTHISKPCIFLHRRQTPDGIHTLFYVDVAVLHKQLHILKTYFSVLNDIYSSIITHNTECFCHTPKKGFKAFQKPSLISKVSEIKMCIHKSQLCQYL